MLHLQRGVKKVSRRNGVEFTGGREVKVGKLKSASSKRDVPLNQAAVDAILDLRAERCFGEDAPLIPDEHGDYTRPVNFRRRYYRILEAAGVERKGLHSIRHPYVKYATTLFTKFFNYFSRFIFYTGCSLTFHSSSLNPTSTKSSPMRSGRLMSIPSEASSLNCSSSLIVGSLSFK